jgi:luciferase family oxidoreductase group 1
MKTLATTPISVLDLATYPQGGTIPDAFRASRALAQSAERWGYRRYWVAEHHNLEGVGSSATVILMGYLAEATSTIRIGSGGIMLPNHAPLVVAEQIGTLESLYAGRIDLGLGRAPGTDQLTMRALRRNAGGRGEEFDEQVAELLSYFAPATPGQAVKAIPGAGIDVPVWILGSSLYSAHFAAAIGRPYAFASHFAPDDLLEALEIYRREFKPSKALSAPYVMVGVPALAAETDERAEFLATSMYQRFLGIIKGQRFAARGKHGRAVVARRAHGGCRAHGADGGRRAGARARGIGADRRSHAGRRAHRFLGRVQARGPAQVLRDHRGRGGASGEEGGGVKSRVSRS